MSRTYELVDKGRAIKCLVCGKVSYHPDDVKNRYCGFCNAFHDDRELANRNDFELEKPERFK